QAPAQPSLTQATAADHLAVVPRAKAASSVAPVEEELAVSTPDLMHLRRVVEEKDGGPAWTHMMDRTLPTFRYQAWKREPQNGPPQYRSSTIFEDASPDVVRDFFWDDDFRISNTWDDMLLEHETLEECAKTGTMVVRWVRKFPFFCSDREYVIGRRIWASGKTYYCVTKSVPRPSVPRSSKPRRVDLYYSSWCIRPGIIPVPSMAGSSSLADFARPMNLHLLLFYQLNQETVMVQ
uniref:START domain-containing protein n=1 Tax=Aegilops tauschii subsp. strangulata TaxID=200361 RepID=A0A453A822_AEGTS